MTQMHINNRPGFTLLEMAVVVVILAGMAVLVVARFDGVQDDASRKVAQSELNAIRDAVRRFKADTGYLPKHGPFGLVADGGLVDLNQNNIWPVALAAADREAWFDHPSNLYQLREHGNEASNRLGLAGCLARYLPHDAAAGLTWNAQTGRGYRGPYLSRDANAQTVDGLAEMPVALDPWGRAYELVLESGGTLGPHVFSYGPDGELNSTSDAIAGDDLAAFIFE